MLDTNAVGLQRPLRGSDVRFLVEAHRDEQINLLCPRVVFDEVVGRWDREFRVAVERHTQAQEAVARFDVRVTHQTRLDPDDEASRLRARLTASLQEAGIELVELPSVGHAEVLARALRRQQPFDARGRDGYRDTLLWETVLSLAPRFERLLLVSTDVVAFGEQRKRRELAQQLRAEYVARGGRENGLQWATDPREAIAMLALAPSDARIAAQEVFDHHRRAFTARLAEIWADSGESPLMHLPIDLSRFGPPWNELTANSTWVSWVNSVTQVRIGQARAKDDETLFATIVAEVGVEITLVLSTTQFEQAAQRADLNRLLRAHLSSIEDDRCDFVLPARVEVTMTATFQPRARVMHVGDDIEILSGRIA
ncbi:PIN domain-containing protein [Conexibacter stalactiti]|uniref:PIN domain-containing protein n=1 Tax=Conexibacter stalactiti TaxID=1940611 RepID=A0ABU4HHT2_9ACTN|nr:PIN domain-containing protein [Conexibacter stalactiti]MDW5592869.1 PIN domain-containing protein [Conexibacter stalactiti]MEC5033510.1 PIN domain-containing protein [Conexibacter stalactiti]